MMTIAHADPTLLKPLRLWPGVALVIIQWLLWFVLQTIAPDAVIVAAIGGLGAGLAILIWWVFFSRAPWSDRAGAVVLMILAVAATQPFLDKSTANPLFFLYVIPGLCLALVASAATNRRLSAGSRRIAMAAMILIACGVWTALRIDGINVGHAQVAWRWSSTAEERLLAQARDEPLDAVRGTPATPVAPRESVTAPTAGKPATLPSTPGPATETPAGLAMSERGSARVEWPGFRGPARDGIVRGVRINTDWSASPPVAMWRRPIGPGWSSFSVHGDLLYTQEQRGDDEIVGCYRVSTGKPVWQHRDATRFWEMAGGAGPRATPTLSHDRVYAFGATGILNALDAGTGAVVWSRNAANDARAEVPTWGFASSPLVVDDAVIVSAGGTLTAYDAATGKPRWIGPRHRGNYSSPQLFTIDGVAQILLLCAPGAIGVSPADGTLLWEHAWESGSIVQPALTEDGDVLIGALSSGPAGLGIRRLAVTRGPANADRSGSTGWTATVRWTSTGLKPHFNDFVVHKGHAYGLDGTILSCIDLADGKRIWKGGRYGGGQLVLVSDQDLLLVLSEDGDLALVNATPDKFTERARFPAIEGKTWNHPVLVGDVVLVRNDQEMAAFRLSRAGSRRP